MIENIPAYLPWLFGLTVVFSLLWFYSASGSRMFLILSVLWILLHSVLGIKGFYEDTSMFPPKLFFFSVLPAVIIIIVIFSTSGGRRFMDGINLQSLTYFHSIRILVEITLLLLYFQKQVSVYMTFEGTNFDILSGLSAPVVGFLAFRGGQVRRKLLMAWNIICLLLLFNVVITAVLGFPSPMQVLSLNQPNAAPMYFPFNLLPAYIVPLVLFGHLVAFRRLSK